MISGIVAMACGGDTIGRAIAAVFTVFLCGGFETTQGLRSRPAGDQPPSNSARERSLLSRPGVDCSSDGRSPLAGAQPPLDAVLYRKANRHGAMRGPVPTVV